MSAKNSLAVLAMSLLLGSSHSVNAGLIKYSWSGYVENGLSNNVFGFDGDGDLLATKEDGTPFTIEILVDQTAPDTITTVSDRAGFIPVSIDLTFGGKFGGASGTLTPDTFGLVFYAGAHISDDGIGIRGNLELNGQSGGFWTGAWLPGSSFDLIAGQASDVPPIFGVTTSTDDWSGQGVDTQTWVAQGTTVTGVLQEVPEPSSIALLGMGGLALFGQGWPKRKLDAVG